MQDFDIQQMIGPSVLMPGVEVELDEAIRFAEERFPGRSLCVVREWVWLDLEAPYLVNEELASEGKQPVMLLVFQVLFDSSTSLKAHWFRTTPLIEFSDGSRREFLLDYVRPARRAKAAPAHQAAG